MLHIQHNVNISHTDHSHPDHKLLLEAQKEIHGLLELINCTERESLELEQQQQSLRELEQMIEGLSNLVLPDRQFLRHETVTMPSAQGTIKDRALFLFNDLLLITSVKRRTGTIKKPTPWVNSDIVLLWRLLNTPGELLINKPVRFSEPGNFRRVYGNFVFVRWSETSFLSVKARWAKAKVKLSKLNEILCIRWQHRTLSSSFIIRQMPTFILWWAGNIDLRK